MVGQPQRLSPLDGSNARQKGIRLHLHTDDLGALEISANRCKTDIMALSRRSGHVVIYVPRLTSLCIGRQG